MTEYIQPVSYTHLDVYKSQLLVNIQIIIKCVLYTFIKIHTQLQDYIVTSMKIYLNYCIVTSMKIYLN